MRSQKGRLMGAKTGIEWTDATWNPIIGCSRVSEGCRNCYAEGIAGRFGNGKETVYSGLTQIVNGRPVWTGQIKETQQLLQPLSWRKQRKVFVNSMSDLFHQNVTDEQRDRIFAVMFAAGRHTFQVLTKRPQAMLDYFSEDNPRYTARKIVDTARAMGISDHVFDCDIYFPLMNVWLGVSVENQAAADERIPILLKTPAAKRFISAEPLLGPITFDGRWQEHPNPAVHFNWLDGLDWVIAGGESGPNARPMHVAWARTLRDESAACEVPFFFKQWGEWLPGLQYEDVHRAADPDEAQSKFPCMDWDDELGKWFDTGGGWADDLGENAVFRVGKKLAGALLDGVEHKQFPGGAY